MSSGYEKLPLTIANLYSELLQQTLTAERMRSLGNLKATFIKKTVKSNTYYYIQYSLAGKKYQEYIGLETPELTEIIQTFHREKSLKTEDTKIRKQISETLKKSGINLVQNINAKVLKILSESGVFRLGGVLVGTNAFIAYSSMLGIRWQSAIQTQDIDIAQDREVSVALADQDIFIDFQSVLERAKLGFLPVPPFNHKEPSTSFKIRGKETILDLLVPLKGRDSSKPVSLPNLKASATALRHLDYLIEDFIQLVIPYDAGILVNVPHPLRYAFHKIYVSQKRTVAHKIKARKDLEQAKMILDFFKHENPAELKRFQKTVSQLGKSTQKRVRELLR